jgi:hypothetical protein
MEYVEDKMKEGADGGQPEGRGGGRGGTVGASEGETDRDLAKSRQLICERGSLFLFHTGSQSLVNGSARRLNVTLLHGMMTGART